MTISSTIRKAGPFIGNGSTTSFPFAFKIFETSDLLVVLLDEATNTETTLVLNSNYTATMNGDQNGNPGGTVTLIAGALASGYTLTITSDLANLQPTDLTNQGGFYPDVINDALDRSTVQIQQLQEQTDRSLKIAVSSTANVTLPPESANQLLGWDATGQNLANIDPGTLATIVAYATAYADTFTGDGTTVNWVLSHDPAVLYNLDVSINGVTQVPTVDYTLTGTTFTTTTAAPTGAVILVKYSQALPNMSADSQDVRYLPPFTGSTSTTVEAKLAQTVSVKDFGAVGDGVTDDTAAIQAAIDALSDGQLLVINAGNYIAYGININKSNIIVENYGNFTLPNNARASIFRIAEGVTDVVFRNYGIIDGNNANQGDLNTIPLGTGCIEISNDTATNYTYRITIQNYGTIKNGANNGIYYHRKINDLTIDPIGFFENHRNDGIAGSSNNSRLKVGNGIVSKCGAFGQGLNINADYSEIYNVIVKNPTESTEPYASNSGISIGHSGTPEETGYFTQITNCQVIDIANSAMGLILKPGLSNKSIINGNVFSRTAGETSGGIAIRLIGGVANGKGIVIDGNTIDGPWGVGISSWDFTSTGYSFSDVVISNNYIDVSSAGANAVGVQLYSGSSYTITGNQIVAYTYGIETQLDSVTITSNRIDVLTGTGIKVKDGSDNLVCVGNNIHASSVANSIVLDAYDANRLIGLNNKNSFVQSGVPISPLVVGQSSSNPALAGVEAGSVKSFTVSLNNQTSGKTSSTYQGGIYFISNLTDNTSAIFAYTGLVVSAGFTILTSSGSNWSTTYNASSKEGIALNASGDGPIIFSNLGASKNYQIICFGGS